MGGDITDKEWQGGGEELKNSWFFGDVIFKWTLTLNASIDFTLSNKRFDGPLS